MSSKLAGTRQVRKMIGHVITGARCVYCIPTFATVTPSERHSGLAFHLSRSRGNDPAIRIDNPEFHPFIPYDKPSLYQASDFDETVIIDLPEYYDPGRLLVNRDPLCVLHAFLVTIKVVLANLYGVQMCADCPHCVQCEDPCMDVYGSNATPMGGSAGRADALVGAVEAQKAECVLHLHLFIVFISPFNIEHCRK